MDKSRLDTSKGLLPKPTLSSQIQHNDSFEMIKRSRNEIVDKSTLVTQSEQAARCQSPLVPRLIHLVAVDSRQRQRVQSAVKFSRAVHCKHSGSEESGVARRRKSGRREEGREDKLPGKRGSSFDCIRRSELGKVVADIKRRRRNEQHMDQLLDQIMAGNVGIEDVLGNQGYEGRHQQIISTIPTGLNFPTPRYPNVPLPMTGRFNIPEEDKAGTVKAQHLPSLAASNISQLPDIEVESNEGSKGGRRKTWLWYCCKSGRCNLF